MILWFYEECGKGVWIWSVFFMAFQRTWIKIFPVEHALCWLIPGLCCGCTAHVRRVLASAPYWCCDLSSWGDSFLAFLMSPANMTSGDPFMRRRQLRCKQGNFLSMWQVVCWPGSDHCVLQPHHERGFTSFCLLIQGAPVSLSEHDIICAMGEEVVTGWSLPWTHQSRAQTEEILIFKHHPSN